MSPLTKKLITGTAVLATAAMVVVGARYLDGDAFKGYRFPKNDEQVGVRLYDVDMKVYEGEKLVTTAAVDRIDVRRDRQFYELFGVKGTSGEPKMAINFSSERAVYDTIAKSLLFDQGVAVKNADLELYAPLLTLNERMNTISSPSKIAGKAMGGRMVLANLKYGMNSRELVTGPIRWNGRLPRVLQDGSPVPEQKPYTLWDFESTGSTSQKGDLVRFKKIRATDGEVLLRAEEGEWNRKTDVLTCTGKVFYYGDKVNLVADKVVVFRKERRALATGTIRMLIKPKDQANIVEEIPPFRPEVPDSIASANPTPPTPTEIQQQKDLDEALRSPENVRKYAAIVVGEAVELFYAKGARRATITGNPECLQDFPGGRWRRVKSARALWNGQEETMRLEGAGSRLVNLKTSIGDDLFATWFEVSVKEGEDSPQDWEAAPGLRGKFVRTEEEDIPPPPTESGTSGTSSTTSSTGTTGTTGSTGG